MSVGLSLSRILKAFEKTRDAMAEGAAACLKKGRRGLHQGCYVGSGVKAVSPVRD